MILLKKHSDIGIKKLYFEAFCRIVSHAGSHDEFPQAAYTNPQLKAKTCVDTSKIGKKDM